MSEQTLATKTSGLRDPFRPVPPPEPATVWQPREMQEECFPAPGQHLVG
jgi:hypothetical protein